MSTATYELLAASSDHVIAVAMAFIGGLVIAGALIWAVRVGMGVMERDTHHPGPEEQPCLPDGGPVRETREMREPDEVPVAVSFDDRLLPHELHRARTRTGRHQQRPRWQPGSSGGFGSGGLGHV
ncbi:DUF6479 family protein [Streptomyces sp. NPDC052701]|uniref:DUF6479 family protein n=1 Tax=Streptomyces sp. NPDC052701 TaxID=3155533 RepID=UPI00342C4C4E